MPVLLQQGLEVGVVTCWRGDGHLDLLATTRPAAVEPPSEADVGERPRLLLVPQPFYPPLHGTVAAPESTVPDAELEDPDNLLT